MHLMISGDCGKLNFSWNKNRLKNLMNTEFIHRNMLIKTGGSTNFETFHFLILGTLIFYLLKLCESRVAVCRPFSCPPQTVGFYLINIWPFGN